MSQTKVHFDLRSKDDHSEAEDLSRDDDSSTSSSRMINFELSNGHPYGPHVPASIEDEQYVEYELEDLTGFPCTAEEEEKMLMEAVMASLKDMEMNAPRSEGSTLASKTDSFESSRVGDPETSSTTITCGASKTESTSSSIIHDRDLTSDHPSPGTSTSSSGAAPEVPSSRKCKDEESTRAKPSGEAPRAKPSGEAPIRPSEEADVSGKTKATLTVTKNPTGNILDGLIRRWDLNCFRSR